MCFLDLLELPRSKRYYYREEIVPARQHRYDDDRHRHHHHNYSTSTSRRVSLPAGVTYARQPQRASYSSVRRSTHSTSPRVSSVSYHSSRPIVYESRARY